MRTTSIVIDETPLLAHVLRRADDMLVLGHRVSEWCGHAPSVEEDIALANMGLDLIGQARALYQYAAEVDGAGRSEDDFAYLRDPSQFRNCLLVEQPNGDFAATIVRQLLFSAFIDEYWRGMMGSKDEALAAIAAKAEKESAYHVRHSGEWLIRLGDGTEESRQRAQAAIDELWPFTGELFETDAAEQALMETGVAVDAAPLKARWDATVGGIIAEATLTRPQTGWMQTGGRAGRHTEHLGRMLTDLQYLQRTYPGATW